MVMVKNFKTPKYKKEKSSKNKTGQVNTLKGSKSMRGPKILYMVNFPMQF